MAPLTFITRVGFYAITLAYVLDSLVRVSRRDSKRHFRKVAEAPRPLLQQPCLRQPKLLKQDMMHQGPPCVSKKGTLEIQFGAKSLLTVNYETKNYSQQLVQSGIMIFYRFLLNSFRSFNSLFKVLFIFPSQYLFAIGLP